MESINSGISFDTKIVWLGLLFVLKFCQETSKKQPEKHYMKKNRTWSPSMAL